MKRKTKIIFAVVLAAIALGLSLFAIRSGRNLNWDLDRDAGVLTITGRGAMKNWTYEKPSPWTERDNYRYVKEVSLPRELTSIGDAAFISCMDLTIHAAPGTAAEAYAKENRISFQPLETQP